MDDELAFAQLRALVGIPGALRVITNEVRPDLRLDTADPNSAARDGVDLKLPSTFVVHNVVALEGPDHRGLVAAFTAEGDYCMGKPGALLRRLQEWRA